MNTVKVATLGGGCFWCTEAIYKELKGVISVTSGYSGGEINNPTYKEVCTGNTNHAEVVSIEYDVQQINYLSILEVFFATHDPTTINRQGADVGSQYRSIIFYHDDEQKQIAENVIKNFNDNAIFNDKVVTKLEPFSKFYPAEEYHQNYFENNPTNAFCNAVLVPKREKFRNLFKKMLK